MTLTIWLIAIGLAMDAFAVSISNGITRKDMKTVQAVEMAAFFGSFQAFMPMIGWTLGLGFREFIASLAYWIAFGLLSLIGGKMVYESFHKEKNEQTAKPLSFSVLFLLAVATSIDALAVGLSFSFLKLPIVLPSIMIGLVTFLISFAGVYVGKIFGKPFESKAEIIGGLVLIGIGVKILIYH